MAPSQRESQRQCQICFVILPNVFNLVDHSLSTGHQADQCCDICFRRLRSQNAVEQHKHSHHRESHAANRSTSLVWVPNADTGPQSFPTPTSYSFSDRTYKPFTPPDMNIIYDLLLATCHSEESLKRECYFVRDDLNNDSYNRTKEPTILKECLPTPPTHPWYPKRKAVALDCEMAGVEGGGSEIVSICVVDFFTKEVLVNSLVKPREFIVQWRSEIHGVTPAAMAIAAASQQVLDGWREARGELWKHINEQTVLVGQSLHNDLKVLRVVHTKIVDTAIVSSEAAFGREKPAGRKWGLEVLCKELLNLRIRLGSGVHNDMEDTMATREVALWCLCHPMKLKQWGENARTSFYAERERQIQRQKSLAKTAPFTPGKKDREEEGYMQRQRNLAQKVPPTPGNNYNGEEGYIQHYYCSDDELLHWEDVVPREIWPKSPPDSD
ncbi:ribonuclease H-like domain-containing protein [Ilyonectria robusta]|uniref:ribonuclease H-like domain-containing protein n=1 Tax=Ilyonectria robusta TaxID=1079257 RepID=UPI001E8DE7AC|nr:ribonuclease H-like domain-containing protein [Ilyonectria robusta]KAH8663722.1 ribonuclease H-like domain-containing protein [Ilyonectria robusta]